MIAHENKGVDLPRRPAARLIERIEEEEETISVVDKDVRPPVATTHDVISSPLELDSRFASHRNSGWIARRAMSMSICKD